MTAPQHPPLVVPDDGYVGTHYLDEEEVEAVAAVLRAKSLFRYEGPNHLGCCARFEAALAAHLGVPHVLGVNTGTAALEMALRALGVGPGDEVILPPYTFMATGCVVLQIGAVPVFADVDETLGLDPDAVAAAITPRTRAILAVHMRGVPCAVDRLAALAARHGIALVEDCAQSIGADLGGVQVGAFGDAAGFSLQANKIITTGEGGVFVARDADVYDRARRFHDFGGVRRDGKIPTWNDPEAGWGANYKLGEIQGALGLVQLRKLGAIVAHQRALDAGLRERLAGRVPLRAIPTGANPVPFTLAVRFDDGRARDAAIAAAAARGLRLTTMDSWFLPRYTAFAPYVRADGGTTARSDAHLARFAWFPLSPRLTPEHMHALTEHLLALG